MEYSTTISEESDAFHACLFICSLCYILPMIMHMPTKL